MDEGKVFDIPAENLDKFRTTMDRLSKKAKKLLGDEGEFYFTVIGWHEIEDSKKRIRKIYEVFLFGLEPIISGYEFIGKVDHSHEAGNIIRNVPGKLIPPLYRDRGPYCDHCQSKRMRRDTYIIRHMADNTYHQVGSSCLRDFIGHGDPEKYAKLAELWCYAQDTIKGYSSLEPNPMFIHVESYLSKVAMIIRTRGWVSRKQAMETGESSTSVLAELALNSPEFNPSVTDEDIQLARDVIAWAQQLPNNVEFLNDWQHNIHVISMSEFSPNKMCSLAASMVGAYSQQLPRNNKYDLTKSVYTGEVGKRLKGLEVTVVKCLFNETWNSYVVTCISDDGNVFVWFTKDYYAADERLYVNGTVKRHSEYKNVKGTMLTRVKIGSSSK